MEHRQAAIIPRCEELYGWFINWFGSWFVAGQISQVEQLPGIRTEDFRLVCGRQLETVKGSENDPGFDPRMVAGKEQPLGAHELMAKSDGQRKRGQIGRAHV